MDNIRDLTEEALKYQVIRTGDSENTAFIPIMLFDKQDNEIASIGWQNMCYVGEMTDVVLFKSWNPLVLRAYNPQRWAATHAITNQNRHFRV